VSNCVTKPNFVEIAWTAGEICEFQYYASLPWKCLFTPLLGFFGTFSPNDLTHRPNPKKDRPWAEPRHLSYKEWIWVARFELGVETRKKDRTLRTGQDRTGKKSQKGYILPICGEAPTEAMYMNIRLVGYVLDLITCARFRNKIFRGYDFTGGQIFRFPIDFWMGLTTVQRYCAVCVISPSVAVQSIVISVSDCISVCALVYLKKFGKPHFQTSQNFLYNSDRCSVLLWR